MFVHYKSDLNKARGTVENPHFVDELTRLVLQKSFYPKNAKVLVVKPIKVASVRNNGKVYDYYYAPISSLIPYPIHWWVQVKVDIGGGAGTDSKGYQYNVNGHNDLFKIVVYYDSTSVTYELHFYDEDHPNPSLDDVYNKIRCVRYPGRDSSYGCEDIENIKVKDGLITFPTTFSTYTECGYLLCQEISQTYATPAPTHGYGIKPYSSSIEVYVSNTWNPLMDTVDTNPDMSKVWHYYS